MTVSRWSSLVVLSGVLAAVMTVLPAMAVENGNLQIDRVDVAGNPDVRVEVTVPGLEVEPQDLEATFTLTENGQRRPTSVTELPSDDVETVLLIDTSGSMRGGPIEAARRAASAFLERLPTGAKVAVVGFGNDASVLAPFSSDRAAKQVAVSGLVATGDTALYDGVATALAQFTEDGGSAARSIVLLSDGGDTASAATLDEAVAALSASDVRLHAIELRTSESDPSSLGRLAEVNGGRVVPVDDAGALETVYESMASELVNRFELSYRSEATDAAVIRVELARQGATFTGEQEVSFPPAAPPTGTVPDPLAHPEGDVIAVPVIWASPLTLVAAGAAVFLGLLVFALVLLAGREPRRRLATENGVLHTSRPTPMTGLANQATMLAERQLDRHGWQGTLNAALERAGLDLRPGEYIVLAASAVTTAFGTGLVLTNALVGLLLALVTILAARVLLTVLASRRQARFADQLGDVLQLLAGSLRAGYGMMQAIDAIGREAESPAADEFGRLVIEARLGRDVSGSLRALADRMECEDFAWVVQAIEIHREVGGDLAEVLDTVAGTIRERNQIRRQVKALSAEGRYSAYVLLALPFGVAAMIGMGNPEYLAELTGSVPGVIMLVMATVLMGVGALWLRKLTRLVF